MSVDRSGKKGHLTALQMPHSWTADIPQSDQFLHQVIGHRRSSTGFPFNEQAELSDQRKRSPSIQSVDPLKRRSRSQMLYLLSEFFGVLDFLAFRSDGDILRLFLPVSYEVTRISKISSRSPVLFLLLIFASIGAQPER